MSVGQPVFAQQEVSLDYLTVGKGLSAGYIISFCRDSRGFTWLGTRDGLNRFDGNEVRQYRNIPSDTNSVTGNYMRDIAEDPAGNLWISTDECLNIYERRLDVFKRLFLPGDNKPLRSLSCTIGRQENIAIVLLDGTDITDRLSVIYYDLQTQKVIQPAALNSQQIRFIESCWFRVDLMPIRIEAVSQKVTCNLFIPSKNPLHLAVRDNFMTDNAGNSWVNDEQKNTIIIAKDLSAYRTVHFKNAFSGNALEPNSFWALSDSTALCSTHSSGIVLINTRTYTIERHWNLHNAAREKQESETILFYKDNENNCWIGSLPYGISILHLNSASFVYLKHNDKDPYSLSSDFVRCLKADAAGNLWVGYHNRGFDIIGMQDYRLQHHVDINGINEPSNAVISLYNDRQHNMWVNGTISYPFPFANKLLENLYVFPGRPAGIKTGSEPAFINGRCFVQNSDSTFFFSYAGKWVAAYKNRQLKIYDSLLTADVTDKAPFIDSKDRWFVNTYGKIEVIDTHHGWPRKIKEINIMAFPLAWYEDTARGLLWIATASGLVRMNSNDLSYTMITEKEGLPENYLYSVLPDRQNDLWMSSNKGIIKYDVENNSFRNYDESYGLQGNEFNMNAYALLPDGRMAFGGPNGVNVFDPGYFTKDTVPPAIQLLRLRINDEPAEIPAYIGESASIDLGWDQRTIAFDYTAINYFHNDQTRFFVKLEGYDRQWVDMKYTRSVRYANLPAGHYTLLIKAINEDGVETKDIRRLLITVHPAFYNTWWFYTLVALFFITVVMMIIRYRIGQLKKTIALRTRISKDLHDDVGASLSSIHIYSSVAEKMMESDPKKAKEVMQQINENTRQVMDNMSDIVWALNNDSSEEKSFTSRVKNFGYELLAARQISCEYLINEKDMVRISSPEARKNLLMIIKEALNNISKYSGAGKVEIRLGIVGQALELFISDDGKGFDRAIVKAGNGLSNIQKRAMHLQGTCTIESRVGEGTKVVCRFPLTIFSDK